jgi:WD40 repeat protein
MPGPEPASFAAEPRPLAAGAVILLVEESVAVCGGLAASGRPKSAVVEDAVNELLRRITDGPLLDVAVIGYRSSPEGAADAACRWSDPWEGRTFVTSGELRSAASRSPYRLVTSGSAPQVAAFQFCRELLDSHAGLVAPNADPPLVVHLSAGASPDGNPAKAIQRLQELELPSGRPILLQIHLAGRESAPEATRFPSAVEPSQPRSCRDLFDRTSELPDALARVLEDQGVAVGPGARGMIYNARENDLKLFLSAVRSLAQTAFWSRTQPDPAEFQQLQDLVGMLLTARVPLPAHVLCEAADVDFSAWHSLAKHLGEYLLCWHEEATGGAIFKIASQPISGHLHGLAELDLDGCHVRWAERCAVWFSRSATPERDYAVKYGPSYALASQRWDLLEEWLTDFAFIEAKCRAGLAYELVDEYLQTLAALTDDYGDPVQHWREYADQARSLLDNMVSAEEASKAGYDLFASDDRFGRIQAFASFLRYNVHHLDKKLEDVAELANEQVSTAFFEQRLKALLAKTGLPLAECGLGRRVPVRRVSRQVFQGHAGPVNAIALSANGAIAVSGGEDRTLRVWDIRTGRCLHVLQGHLRPVGTVAVSDDGATAVSADRPSDEEHGWLRVWDLTAGRCVREIETEVQHTAVGITPDGACAISEDWHSESKTGNVWGLLTGEWRFTHKLRSSLAITADGAMLIEIGHGRIAVPYDIATGEPGAGLHMLRGWVTSDALAVTPDGRTAVSGGTVWDPISGRELRSLDCGFRRVAGVRLTDDGCVAAVGAGGELSLWHLPTGELVRKLRGHTGTIHGVAMTADGALAVTAGSDGTVRVWDLLGGRDFAVEAAAKPDTGYTCPVCLGERTLRPEKDHVFDWDEKEKRRETLCCVNVFSDTAQYQECGFTCLADQIRTRQLSFAAVAPSCCGGTTLWLAMLHHLIKTGVVPEGLTLRAWPSRTLEDFDRLLEDIFIDRVGPAATQTAEFPHPISMHLDDDCSDEKSGATANVFDFPGETSSRMSLDTRMRRRMLSADGLFLFVDLLWDHRRHETIVREAIRDLWALHRLGPHRRSQLFLAVCVPKLDLLVHVDAPDSMPEGWRETFYENLRAADAQHASWTTQLVKARSELTADLLSRVWPEGHVVQQLREAFQDDCEFFPMSAFGFSELGRTDIGDRAIEPYGVLEPLLWLLHKSGYRTLE